MTSQPDRSSCSHEQRRAGRRNRSKLHGVEDALFVFVRLHSRVGDADKVTGALTSVVNASRSELGCVSIHAFRSARDPQLFFIHSVWKDADAFDRHAEMRHTVDFIQAVDGFLDEPREVTRTRRLA